MFPILGQENASLNTHDISRYQDWTSEVQLLHQPEGNLLHTQMDKNIQTFFLSDSGQHHQENRDQSS